LLPWVLCYRSLVFAFSLLLLLPLLPSSTPQPWMFDFEALEHTDADAMATQEAETIFQSKILRGLMGEEHPKRGAPITIEVDSASDCLHRQYRISQTAAEVPVHECPKRGAKVWATHRAGGQVFTTGKLLRSRKKPRDRWIEVCTCIAATGWIFEERWDRESFLSPVKEGGWHGDRLEGKLFLSELLKAHAHAMLKFSLLTLSSTPPLSGPGCARIERDAHMAHLFTPARLVPGSAIPLIVVFHGFRWDFPQPLHWTMRRAWDIVATRWNILVLVPEAEDRTWDLFTTGMRKDVDFVQSALHEVRQKYIVDDGRIAAFGHSDGGSMAISLAVRNPHVFQTALASAAGRCAVDLSRSSTSLGTSPNIFMEYGTDDEVFDYRTVAVPLKEQLERNGCNVQFRGLVGVGHKQRPMFVDDAISFWLSLPRHPDAGGQFPDEGVTFLSAF